MVNIGGLISAFLTDSIYYWIGSILVLFVIYTVKLPSYLPSFPIWIGFANWITLFRLLIILIAVLFWGIMTDPVLFGLFAGVTILDGVDGYIARKYKQTARPGEAFDMEVDALFVFLLSYMHFFNKNLPLWILIPGGLRYYYELFAIWYRNSKPIQPGKRFRSTVAVIFFISLLLPFVLDKNIYMPVVFSSSLLIVLSFGISAYYLLITRDSSGPPAHSE